VVGVTQVRARVDDEDLEEFLDDVDNKSEAVREALRLYRLQHEAIEDDRLTGAQRSAYRWMREQTGVGGRLRLEVARTVLAQTLSRKKDLIKYTVLQPLENLGYIDVSAGMQSVTITVLPPQNGEDEPGVDVEVDDPEEAGETLDALADAEPEVPESAD
jgi:Arc/MetJ-type ribon-helix-helix transcriptional regulator